MKNTLTLAIIQVTILFTTQAFAKIPSRLYKPYPTTQLNIESQNTDGVVRVVDSTYTRTMYADFQLVELAIEDLSYHKEIYIYDLDRNTPIKVRFVSQDTFFLEYGSAIYLGKSAEGKDHFIISLFRGGNINNFPFSIYVKMNGQQFQTTNIKVAY